MPTLGPWVALFTCMCLAACGGREVDDSTAGDSGPDGARTSCTQSAGDTTICQYFFSDWPMAPAATWESNCSAGHGTVSTTCSSSGLVGCYVLTTETPTGRDGGEYTATVAQCYYAPMSESEAQAECKPPNQCGLWQTTLP
jgi:hypothetical protein